MAGRRKLKGSVDGRVLSLRPLYLSISSPPSFSVRNQPINPISPYSLRQLRDPCPPNSAPFRTPRPPPDPLGTHPFSNAVPSLDFALPLRQSSTSTVLPPSLAARTSVAPPCIPWPHRFLFLPPRGPQSCRRCASLSSSPSYITIVRPQCCTGVLVVAHIVIPSLAYSFPTARYLAKRICHILNLSSTHGPIGGPHPSVIPSSDRGTPDDTDRSVS
ncbi:hypothetical protein NUW54_g11406 [Trametes sanguinea]|uniref:Uncharacterized protein n=1 Tax=Trametes sanguinea TaxID=158606 RepID=A0ACC1NE25_9APHY|nr:hypothetical protein NUW54_g11406 [Trametes sanguinea]